MKIPKINVAGVLLASLSLSSFLGGCGQSDEESAETKIDRKAVVSRHNVILNEPDTLASLSVGNGEFAYTVDVSGLQTRRFAPRMLYG